MNINKKKIKIYNKTNKKNIYCIRRQYFNQLYFNSVSISLSWN